MMAYSAYAGLAILIIILVTVLARRTAPEEIGQTELGRDFASDLGHASYLSLVERLFDPADYVWLRDKVGFPQLAPILARARQRMALNWLKTLRRSFDDLVRTPEVELASGSAENTPGSWQLLWLTFRFHLLLGYALLVVRFLGPYHRLVPSLNWMHSLSKPGAGKERYGTADIANLP